MAFNSTKKNQEYTAIFEEEKTGGYSVWVPDLPGCASQGQTLEEAISNIKEAIDLYVEDNPNLNKFGYHYKKQFPLPIVVN
jgi:predicted RNase H-like HicB family nuclease